MTKVEFTKTAEDDYLALLDELSRRSLDKALDSGFKNGIIPNERK